jgi:hypothetical protein
MSNWASNFGEGLAIGRANRAAADAADSEDAAKRARGALEDWKRYARGLEESLKDTQVSEAAQAVIKEECLRELFLMNPAHRLHVTANRLEVVKARLSENLRERGLTDLAEDTERINRLTT